MSSSRHKPPEQTQQLLNLLPFPVELNLFDITLYLCPVTSSPLQVRHQGILQHHLETSQPIVLELVIRLILKGASPDFLLILSF